MTNKICDRTCQSPHYWDFELMYCQRCSGLITDIAYIIECMESWKKSKKEICEYIEKLNRRIIRIEKSELSKPLNINWEIK